MLKRAGDGRMKIVWPRSMRPVRALGSAFFRRTAPDPSFAIDHDMKKEAPRELAKASRAALEEESFGTLVVTFEQR